MIRYLSQAVEMAVVMWVFLVGPWLRELWRSAGRTGGTA